LDHPDSWGNLKPAHIYLAREFLQSAEQLGGRTSEQEPISLNKPQLFLLAHALELTLKAISLWLGKSEDEVRRDGHSLKAPFNRAKSSTKSNCLIISTEKTVNNRWKVQLRADRESYLTQTYQTHLDETPSNSEISRAIPKLSEVVDWLDAHHANDGGTFRYYETHLFRLPVVSCFGTHRLVIQQTTLWACNFMLSELEKQLRNSNENAP